MTNSFASIVMTTNGDIETAVWRLPHDSIGRRSNLPAKAVLAQAKNAAEPPANPILILQAHRLPKQSSLRRRGARLAGRREDEAFADKGEASLRQFRLKQLVFRAREEVGVGCGDPGYQVVDSDRLAVESSLHVGVGCELDRFYGAGLLGDDGPEVAVVAGYGEGEQGIECAGVEVGKEHRGGVRGQTNGAAASVGGDVEQNLRRIWSGIHVDCGAIDSSAQLDMFEAVSRGEPFGLGEIVVKALHGDAND